MQVFYIIVKCKNKLIVCFRKMRHVGDRYVVFAEKLHTFCIDYNMYYAIYVLRIARFCRLFAFIKTQFIALVILFCFRRIISTRS